MYILYFTFSKKKSKGKVSDLCQGIGKKKGPSKPQLFHTQKANGNSLRMCIDYDIGKPKTPKENLEKEKAIIGLFFGGRETIFYRCTQETTVQENIVRMKSALGPSMNLSKGPFIYYVLSLLNNNGWALT